MLLVSCFLLVVLEQLSAISFNQPKFCSNAFWNPNATTMADNNTVGISPYALFVNTNNTLVTARRDNGRILIWRNVTVNNPTPPTTILLVNLSSPFSLFGTDNEQIFVDGGSSLGRVQKWSSNGTRLSSTMLGSSQCSGLFLDQIDNLYCSNADRHLVFRRTPQSSSNEFAVVVGMGCAGSTTFMLNSPRGIFVTINLDLYVADCGNDRVQFFREGQRNATTVIGNGTIALDCPTGIVLDGDGFLFIVDSSHHRILGQGPAGFRCLVGCSGNGGSASHQLMNPSTIAFDRKGNLFVMDRDNHRLQMFLLSDNSCGKEKRKSFESLSCLVLRFFLSSNDIQTDCQHTNPTRNNPTVVVESMLSTSVDLNSKSVESFLSDSISTQSRFLFHIERRTELQHITFPSVPMGDLQLFGIELSEYLSN